MSLSTIRHDDIFPAYKHNESITIIGAGAVGSRIWSALVELGLTDIQIYDFDNVEAHNLANQIYFNEDIGTPKVAALKKWTRNKLGFVPDPMGFHNEKVIPGQLWKSSNTVFLLVDTIEDRKLLMQDIVDNHPNVFHVYDTRMASTHGNVLHVSTHIPFEVEHYLNNLPTDEETEVSSCGSSLSVGTTASLIANICVWQMMHQRTNPEAMDEIVNFYAKPLCVDTGAWSHE